MKDNITQTKTFAFAERIVKLYRYLSEKHREYVLSKQVLRSGTSIGANIEETIGAGTREEFLQKINISYRKLEKLDTGSAYYKVVNIFPFLNSSLFMMTVMNSSVYWAVFRKAPKKACSPFIYS